MPSELLSHRLVNFRERHGITQVELAELLGVTPRYLSYLEAGTKEIGPESSLYKLFNAYEDGQIPLKRIIGGKSFAKEEPAPYRAEKRTDSVGAGMGLTLQDGLAQAHADLVMIEAGSPTDKRRAYFFLRDMHLPMLARLLNLE